MSEKKELCDLYMLAGIVSGTIAPPCGVSENITEQLRQAAAQPLK